jgi:hypothetical protein
MMICLAHGQRIYFARDAAINYPYARSDANNIKRMFMDKCIAFQNLNLTETLLDFLWRISN